MGERERWQVRLSRCYGNAADRIEAAAGHPVTLPLFTVVFVCGLRISVNVTNIAISYVTAALLFLSIGPNRRSVKATHHKLDDLEDKIQEADSGNVGIEALTEAEIDAIREARPRPS